MAKINIPKIDGLTRSGHGTGNNAAAISIELAQWFMGALLLGLTAWAIEGFIGKKAAWAFAGLVIFVVILRHPLILQWLFSKARMK